MTMSAGTMTGDSAARVSALTELDSTWIVEAAAGSGKTSILAGRVVKLLAAGKPPAAIAAITFTELAASELLNRIGEYAARTSDGNPPKELALAFPGGVGEAERQALARALPLLDELTCTTIHGFCQRLITPYPVEAGIDPGARMADEGESELLFDTVLEDWLYRKLDRAQPGADPLAQLVSLDRVKGLGLARDVAAALRRNPDASGPLPALTRDMVDQAVSAWQEFRDWYRAAGVVEPDKTGPAIEALEAALSGFRALDPGQAEFLDLWKLAHPELPPQLYTKDGAIRKYQAKGKWEAALRELGRSKPEAVRLNDEATARYDAATATFHQLLGACSQEVAARLVPEFAELTSRYRQEKRQAAILDFDDLLTRALELLRHHPEVRGALSRRYCHILVDEFQDTDPVQWEILRLLASEGQEPDSVFRPGQLFAVGDPKQSIFRFRHADIRTYTAARAVLAQDGTGAKLEVSANFRSAGAVLCHVNRQFEPVFAPSPIGYQAMEATIASPLHDWPAVVALNVRNENEGAWRTEEAAAVADLCSRLIGNLPVMRRNGASGLCRPGDIALLSPTGSGLWVYEQALEDVGLPVATQAGKGFYLRQEIQDLIALARVLSDSRDTLAFGALMRGPLVGLTEEELLDITHALPPSADQPPRFDVRTDPDQVGHPLAAQTLRTLQGLRKLALGTTPFDALSAAIAELRVRPLLAQRLQRLAERAIANVDLFLEMARPYAVRGLRAFAQDQTEAWAAEERTVEGRSDAGDAAVQLITIHSAKGLEWSVVILINAWTLTKSEAGILFDRAHRRLQLNVGSVMPPGYVLLKDAEKTELLEERRRLQYVACTRAKDLLVLPRHDAAKIPGNSWAAVVDLGRDDLPAVDAGRFPTSPISVPPPAGNLQDSEQFQSEARRIVDTTRTIRWKRPSDHDGDRAEVHSESPAVEAALVPDEVQVQGGALRGTVLHKLMEEVLFGFLAETPLALESRASVLIAQLGRHPAATAEAGLNPRELSESVTRALALDLVRQWRDRLSPELPVWSIRATAGVAQAVAGVADAVAWNGAGDAEFVFDWKSDVAPTEATVRGHKQQLSNYLDLLRCHRGALVYMATGRIVPVLAVAPVPAAETGSSGG